jgi:hypothetical protein
MMSLWKKIMNFLGDNKTFQAVLAWSKRPQPIATPSVPSSVIMKPINYVMNDPSTPQLIKQVMPPTYSGKPALNVKNYRGGGFARNSVEGQAANCYVTLTNTIKLVNSNSERTLVSWPGTSTLQVLPRAGVDLNAFYDRRSLKFFYVNDARVGGSLYTCDSTDVVSHELGHAILDSFRPETWSAASLEVASMHEAFADFIALMHALSYDEIVNYIVNETQGDLRKNNVASQLAEQFGAAVYKLSDPKEGRSPNALRSTINDFKYVNPGTLPADAPYNKLAAECHSFGRIFLGALYDMLVMIYEDIKQSGKNSIVALKEARNILLKYMLKSIQNAPLNVKFFNSVSKTLLWADVTLGNKKYHDRIQKILANRNLLTTQLMILSAPKCENNDLIIKTQGCMNVKLEDKVMRAQSDDNPLYGVEVEIPMERVYLYDQDHNLYDSVAVSDEESLSAAIDMIKYLHATNSVSDDLKTPFEIKDGKLVRTYFS